MGETEISWTHRPGTVGRTWNFTRGCWMCSEGCLNCYAMKQGGRFSGPGRPYHGLVQLGGKRGPMWTGEGAFVVEHLVDPFTWTEPATAFVNSMSDLFFEVFDFEQIAAGFAVMAMTPEHTYQILTKRSARAVEFDTWLRKRGRGKTMNEMWNKYVRPLRSDDYWHDRQGITNLDHPVCNETTLSFDGGGSGWPLPNVWRGISAENQTRYKQRLPDLLEMEAAIRFISFEPLLGPIDPNIPMCPTCYGTDYDGSSGTPFCTECGEGEESVEMAWGWWNDCDGGVNWAIIGVESGPRARPCETQWIEDLVKECENDGVPVFLKQALWLPPFTMGLGSHTAGRGHNGTSIVINPYLHNKQYMNWPTVEEESDAA
jgi:protein gp37